MVGGERGRPHQAEVDDVALQDGVVAVAQGLQADRASVISRCLVVGHAGVDVLPTSARASRACCRDAEAPGDRRAAMSGSRAGRQLVLRKSAAGWRQRWCCRRCRCSALSAGWNCASAASRKCGGRVEGCPRGDVPRTIGGCGRRSSLAARSRTRTRLNAPSTRIRTMRTYWRFCSRMES